MLAKGDLKFRLDGKKLKGDFALVKMKGRRPGSKGNEWLLIKKHDQYVVEGYDIDAYDKSVLSKRSLAQIAGDAGSAEWKSRPAGGGKLKAAWLADAVAKLDKKKADLNTTTKTTAKKTTSKKKLTTGDTEEHGVQQNKPSRNKSSATLMSSASSKVATYPVTSVPPVVNALPSSQASSAGVKRPMPTTIHPMLATPVDEPFDGAEWLFEIKWDGYRAIAFIEDGKLRLVSRNQNELTQRFPELKDLPKSVRAKSAILDGEVVALDDEGRASFSLMQQRTGFRPGGRRGAAKADVPVLYYAFDLLYLDGYDLRKVALEERKRKLASVLVSGDSVRYSDHYEKQGKALFEMARAKGLEGILAKKRDSIYQERRTSEWLKIKITRRLECVIGGYTEPEGSRAHFGSVVLGLYDKQGRLIHVGQAGSGFDQQSLDEVWKLLKKLETRKNPFHGEVEALRKVYWVKPELVAEIEFAEWTGGTSAGSGPKLRAPVFLGLRDDKDPKDCRLEQELKS
jgi:bifunctional non-homologous end joining protein LigD